jgi:hypothetical protein
MGLSLSQRIAVFSELGKALRAFEGSSEGGFLGADFSNRMEKAIQKAYIHNGWFAPQYVHMALQSWGMLLNEAGLRSWTKTLPEQNRSPKRVGIVMAGNIPLVGFHDLLAVLISGHKAVIKMSSEDNQLLPVLLDTLLELAPDWTTHIELSQRVNGVDAVIATGSNNSARYFHHYFEQIPHIIRRNRNSVALITDETTDVELSALARDITDYFGRGCRSVSKLYIPKDFDLDRVFKGLYPFSEMIHNKKYGNNCDYHRAIFLMNQEPILENGFMIFRAHGDLASPVAVMHYERYEALESVQAFLHAHSDDIQCVVASHPEVFPRAVAFGQSQCPALDDYADGVNTLEFLSRI